MADDQSNRHFRERVSAGEDYEVEYFAKKGSTDRRSRFDREA